MSRFFFHVRDGEQRFVDGVGADFPDLAAAWALAIIDVRRIIDEQVLTSAVERQYVEIGDASGAVGLFALQDVTELH